MKKFGKLMAFAALFILFIAFAVGRETGASINAGADVLVDYVNETMTVTTTKDTVIYFTDVYYPDITRWEQCEVRDGKAVFDISWVKDNKTVRMYLCGDVQDTVVNKDIAWKEKLKVVFTGTLLSSDITEAARWKTEYAKYPKFSIDTGYFIFTLEENGRDTSYFDLQTIEWRKGDDGAWRAFSELDLKEMNIKGVELQFRIKAVNDTAADAGSRTSSLAVTKVLSLASAPQTALNPNTMEVSVKNGQEVSLDRKTWVLIPDYNKKLGDDDYLVTEAERATAITTIMTNVRVAGLSLQQLLDISGNDAMDYATLTTKYPGRFTFDDPTNPTGVILYVRTAGTSKKAASKIAEIVIPLTGAGVTPKKDALEISNTTSSSASAKAGVTIINTSDDKYQVAVITPEQYAALADKNNIDVTQYYWHSIKGGKTLKLTRTKVPQGSYLMYRIAGEEDGLPSAYIITDTPVDYTTPAVTPTPTQVPAP